MSYFNPATEQKQDALPEGWEQADGMVFDGTWYPWSVWFEPYSPGDYRRHDYRAQFWAENQALLHHVNVMPSPEAYQAWAAQFDR